MRRLLEDMDWSDRKWLHFSDSPFVKFHARGFHQDPLGIYFFPADHVPAFAIWHEKTYRFTARLKPGVKVLELAKITDQQLANLLRLTDSTQAFNDYIRQYPPKSHKDRVRMAWEMMRNHYMRSTPPAWTKAILNAGWDAIYDEVGIIHSAEPQQLLLVNPRMLVLTDMQTRKLPVFASVSKVMHDVAQLGSQFAKVSTEGPKRVKRDYSTETEIAATVRLDHGENYLVVKIAPHGNTRGFLTKINASVQYAWPWLQAGYGAVYDMIGHKYDKYSDLDQLRTAMEQTFHSEVTPAD